MSDRTCAPNRSQRHAGFTVVGLNWLAMPNVIELAAAGNHSVNEAGTVRHYVAKDAVVCALTNASAWPVKLCRVAFGKDASIYVSFPYLTSKNQGVLSALNTQNDHSGPYTYDLAKDGTLVDRHVKFAHHASGEVHFSDTGLGTPMPARTTVCSANPFVIFSLQVYDGTTLVGAANNTSTSYQFVRVANTSGNSKSYNIRLIPLNYSGLVGTTWGLAWAEALE